MQQAAQIKAQGEQEEPKNPQPAQAHFFPHNDFQTSPIGRETRPTGNTGFERR